MKIKAKLINCYGIRELNETFDFTSSNSISIYSPNGQMKSSFSKTFQDLCFSRESKDLVFENRKNIREILDENDNPITSEMVFVIEPYNENFDSNKLSTLLISKNLKDEYEAIYSELEVQKNAFITRLKSVSQSTDSETEFFSTFSKTGKESFFELIKFANQSLEKIYPKYTFRYNDIFDKQGKVKKFLIKHEKDLDLYTKNYDELISNSDFFKKSDNTFGTYQASNIHKAVSDNSFFDAGHKLTLSDGSIFNSEGEFEQRLLEEIINIINDAKLKKIFDKVDKDLSSNSELRNFRSVLEKDNSLLTQLKDYDQFKKKVWMSYLFQLNSEVTELIKLYESKKEKLEAVVKKANEETTDWENAIELYNERFIGMPFRLSISNKEDVLLKTSAPVVEFTFCDSDGEKTIEKDALLTVLSQGELRALYLLNIIFEIEARKKVGSTTIIIIDDIADSFDYKNKYAIIEYLKDIAETPHFYQIILTHNFDFFRTLQSRGIVGYRNCFFSYKSGTKISIEKASGIKNPFINDWMKDLTNNKKLVASIPFIRNIIEYTRGEQNLEYLNITALLHWKSETPSFTLRELQTIFTNTIPNLSFPNTNLSNIVVDVIFTEADKCLLSKEGINFENKIVLSIASRLLAEKFMIKEINDDSFVSKIVKNQTIKLLNKFKELFPNNKNSIQLLENVNLITPENIHLNSFMYEPILDMGENHLKILYENIKKL